MSAVFKFSVASNSSVSTVKSHGKLLPATTWDRGCRLSSRPSPVGRLGTASPTRLLGPRWLQTLHLYTLHVGAAALLLLMFSASKQRHHQKPILPTFLSAMVHRRVATAYTDWLIAANGIASHHAASRSGIRLLLLLILAVAASGRFPPLPGPRSRRTGTSKGPSPEGWPI